MSTFTLRAHELRAAGNELVDAYPRIAMDHIIDLDRLGITTVAGLTALLALPEGQARQQTGWTPNDFSSVRVAVRDAKPGETRP